MSPYKPYHDRVQLQRLIPHLVVRRHRCNSEELGHPSDGAASIYGHHRIALVEFNLVSIHLLHSSEAERRATARESSKRDSVPLAKVVTQIVTQLFATR